MNVLEELEQNIEPSSKKNFHIKINMKLKQKDEKDGKKDKTEKKQLKFEEESEKLEEELEKAEPSSGIIIKDKSKLSHFNRKDILNGLKGVFLVQQRLVSQAPTPL